VIAKSKAFTFLELLVVMVIVGFMITIIPSWLTRKKADENFTVVLREFNNFLLFARQESVTMQEPCRLLFKKEKSGNDFVVLQKLQKKSEDSDEIVPVVLNSDYFNTKYILPSRIKMEAFYSGKKEMFYENKNEGYCYIMPNTLIENVIIHMTRKTEGGFEKVTFKTEPFVGEFNMFNGFLKPE
jgi:prepilin-type N-terminal cleavage/methylation domain-containing protein